MRYRAALVVAFGVFGVLPRLVGDENLKPPAQMTSTEHMDFAPGGTIRFTGSYGDLYVEAWDQAQVELSVRKFMPYEYNPERSTAHLEAVRVVSERPSASELTFSTVLPPHKGLPWHPLAPSKTGQVRIEYEIHVPRKSHLVIHHGVGLVAIKGVTGDIDANCHRGDIVLWLPESGEYSIDARNKFGKVSSDFTGATHARFIIGQKFTNAKPSSAQRLHLRMGFGGITLKPILPESETKAAVAGGA